MAKFIRYKNLFLVIFAIILLSCKFTFSNEETESKNEDYTALAFELEKSLFDYVVDAWYPHCIDTVYGGYLTSFEYDWTLSSGSQDKGLIYQARHLWSLSYLYEHYPEHQEFLEYAKIGFDFLKNNYPDPLYGGLFSSCTRDGNPSPGSISFKRSYGHAFAIYGLTQYFKVSNDSSALDLAVKSFRWLDENAHDKENSGYFESLHRDGTPRQAGKEAKKLPGYLPVVGLKEFNSSIHILEALTSLYNVWPDSLLQKRLEEMFHLFRDTIIHPEGYLQLYFYPDWSLVPEEVMDSLSEGNVWFTQHLTYGHDVETAYLMHEAARALGKQDDRKTQKLMKKLVDHSLQTGWDEEKGGFYYIGFRENGKTRIHDPHKSYWTNAEGLNALMLMHTLYPEDSMDYYKRFLELWNYTDKYLIDKEYGGWYSYGLDNNPESKYRNKSHNWKANYHNTRALVHCIRLLEELKGF